MGGSAQAKARTLTNLLTPPWPLRLLRYARLRDSFNGGRTPSMDQSGSTARTLSVNDFGGSQHTTSQASNAYGEYTFGANASVNSRDLI